MRLGLFMMPVHPPARSFTETLAEDEEKSLLAEEQGSMRLLAQEVMPKLRQHAMAQAV